MPLDVFTSSFGPISGVKDGTQEALEAVTDAVSRVLPRPRRSGSRANSWMDQLPDLDRVYAGGAMPFDHHFETVGNGDPLLSRIYKGCADPGFVWVSGFSGHYKQKVACRKCRHCLHVAVNERATAIQMELETADWAYFLTLTFSPEGALLCEKKYGDPLADKVLDLKHMNRFHARVRMNMRRSLGSFAGVKTTSWRYVQCAELGDLKGRAHYHVIVFGMGDPPVFPHCGRKGRVHIPEWEFGHVNISGNVDRGVAFYLSSYIHKKHGKEALHSASKCPAIGAHYARQLGRDHAMIGAEQPPIAWRVAMNTAAGRRYALIRGARQREYIAGMCEARGIDPWGMYKRAHPTTHAAIRAFIVAKLDREQRGNARMWGQIYKAAETEAKRIEALAMIDEIYGGQHIARNRDFGSLREAEPVKGPERRNLLVDDPPLPAHLRSDWVPVGWRDTVEAQETAKAWNASLRFEETYQLVGGSERGQSPPLRRVTRFASVSGFGGSGSP